ncbi:MAG: permease-like cell division protein FtsX [Flammeovirgaceae bacterium]|nr:permease-like cell division protein FtsX [Flammeovirgaceae bacterium]MDW8286579.1 permease-like cell division protein FtsX [Flammeovirgaceae bacterium]
MSKIGQKRKIHGSYPSVNVVFSLCMGLFLIGLLALFTLLAEKLATHLKKGMQVHVFLEKELTPAEIQEIRSKIKELPFVATETLLFISKEEAKDTMVKETGEDFVTFLGENPLRDVFLFNIKENKPLQKHQLDELLQIPGIFEITESYSFVEKIQQNIRKASIILVVLVSVFFLTVFILINNAIRLALFSQRFLIRSMQLVGATAFFIKKPFLVRATVHGIVGGVLASLFLWLVWWVSTLILTDIRSLIDVAFLVMIHIGLVAIGGLASCMSAWFAINKYLKMSLDELY